MLEALWEDIRRYPGPWPVRLRILATEPGFWAVASHRLVQAAFGLPLPLRICAKALIKPAAFGIQLLTGVQIGGSARIGPGLYIGHWGGIVVHGKAVLGARCNLAQGVTIGEGEGPDGDRGVPVIGDRVYIGPGAKLFGPIRIGNDVAIGANAVVNRDVPSGVSVGGIPARVISERGSGRLIQVGQPLRPAVNVVRIDVDEAAGPFEKPTSPVAAPPAFPRERLLDKA